MLTVMKVDLALDVEVALPASLRKRKRSIIQKQRFYPNATRNVWQNMMFRVSSVLDGPLSVEQFIQAVITGQVDIYTASMEHNDDK